MRQAKKMHTQDQRVIVGLSASQLCSATDAYRYFLILLLHFLSLTKKTKADLVKTTGVTKTQNLLYCE
jgi:hypothetical protein